MGGLPPTRACSRVTCCRRSAGPGRRTACRCAFWTGVCSKIQRRLLWRNASCLSGRRRSLCWCTSTTTRTRTSDSRRCGGDGRAAVGRGTLTRWTPSRMRLEKLHVSTETLVPSLTRVVIDGSVAWRRHKAALGVSFRLLCPRSAHAFGAVYGCDATARVLIRNAQCPISQRVGADLSAKFHHLQLKCSYLIAQLRNLNIVSRLCAHFRAL